MWKERENFQGWKPSSNLELIRCSSCHKGHFPWIFWSSWNFSWQKLLTLQETYCFKDKGFSLDQYFRLVAFLVFYCDFSTKGGRLGLASTAGEHYSGSRGFSWAAKRRWRVRSGEKRKTSGYLGLESHFHAHASSQTCQLFMNKGSNGNLAITRPLGITN